MDITEGKLDSYIQQFKDRKAKAKDVFTISAIDKYTAYEFIQRYHYLGKKDFLCSYAYGLWCCGELVGAATFSPPAGVSTIKGWFGLKNNDLSIIELTRLAMLPALNGCNATSFLLSGSIRNLKHHGIRAVITLADASRHVGSIYQVCNFKYFGLSDEKTDFFRYPDMAKNPWGSVKEFEGVWIPRTRKHRYAYILDRKLKCLYSEQKAPSLTAVMSKKCCGGVLRSMISALSSGTHARFVLGDWRKSMDHPCKTYHEECAHFDERRHKCNMGKCFLRVNGETETRCEFFRERSREDRSD